MVEGALVYFLADESGVATMHLAGEPAGCGQTPFRVSVYVGLSIYLSA
ncbi:MAG: hypothetical protein ACRDFX_01920 [Chloroflexota bacterium]